MSQLDAISAKWNSSVSSYLLTAEKNNTVKLRAPEISLHSLTPITHEKYE